MSNCRHCGATIEFRYLNGICTPVHLDGGRCAGYDVGSRPVRHDVRLFEYQQACWPTHCPKCRADVFFVRHNDGSVWLDSLGPPWPKHGCFAAQASDLPGAERFASIQGIDPQNSTIGIVIRQLLEGSATSKYTLLAISAGEQTRFCVALAGTFPKLLGAALVMKFDEGGKVVESLYDEGHPLPVQNPWLDPELLNLPGDWAKIRGLTRESAKVGKVRRPPGRGGIATDLVACPHCEARVRPDRLEKHIHNVHDKNDMKRSRR